MLSIKVLGRVGLEHRDNHWTNRKMNEGYDNTVLVLGIALVLAFCLGWVATIATIYVESQLYAAPRPPWER